MPRKCPACSMRLPDEAAFCARCGTASSSDPTDAADAPKKTTPFAWLARAGVVAVAIIVLLSLFNGDEPSDSSPFVRGPEPGSSADRMCDTYDVGPGTEQYNGKSYDATCLERYPWDNGDGELTGSAAVPASDSSAAQRLADADTGQVFPAASYEIDLQVLMARCGRTESFWADRAIAIRSGSLKDTLYEMMLLLDDPATGLFPETESGKAERCALAAGE